MAREGVHRKGAEGVWGAREGVQGKGGRGGTEEGG